VDNLIKPNDPNEAWAALSLSESLPQSWESHKKAAFVEALQENPAYRLRGTERPVLQWGPDAHISGTLAGDAFFLALYNKRE
jgi:hypothetical protein